MTKLLFSKELSERYLERLKQEIKKTFQDCKKIAIKIHFGEPGNEHALTQEQIKPLTNILRELNIDFFLFDSPVMYVSERDSVTTYQEFVEEKGFSKLGEIRISNEPINIKGKYMDYKIIKELANAEGVLIISHVKGHVCCGFGGAIKNLGMGAQTKETKSNIHAGGKPEIIGKCLQCGTCVQNCPMEGITLENGQPNFVKCYGCSNCVYVCPEKVLKTKIATFDQLLSEAAKVAQGNFKKFYYISIIKNITKECDCCKNPGQIIANEIGYLAGKDGVAIDKASHDLIKKSQGEDVFLKHNKKTALRHIQEAQNIGMGSQDYELVEIS